MTEALPRTKLAEGREAEVFAWTDGAVLRLMRNPDARDAVDRQARAMRAARDAGVRVPAVHDVVEIDGRPGLVMERIDGPDLLTLVARKPWLVRSVGATSGRLHAQLHETAAPTDLPSLRETLERRITTSELVPRAVAGRAVAALRDLPEVDRVCHGDFHPANVIEAGGAAVLIDWSNVARGDPAADVARTLLMLRLADPPPGSPPLLRVGARIARRLMIGAYLRGYRRGRALDMVLVDRWTLPVAANRLVEHVPGERDKLLRLLNSPDA